MFVTCAHCNRPHPVRLTRQHLARHKPIKVSKPRRRDWIVPAPIEGEF